ncbi:hypothetical protein H2204_009460 [Knufia peltigerae]|uniref:NAD(P)-binding protein n=1 Tax=Knufia peltigerae TaxID=1002370 RepID=A0AA38XY28_9EURO|nr:hypothetical protein H2204_009460 [Knufia peltigerae]
MGGNSFDPARDIPSLDGKVILITGGNIGIGKQSALDLSKHNPAQLWIAARNAKTGNETVDEIKAATPGAKVRFLEMDLASFESIKKAVKTFQESSPRLDILMCNAGVMGGPPTTTKEGYEFHIGINHVGHALLFKLLVPQLLEAAKNPIGDEPRVIFVSSLGHKYGPAGGIVFESLKTKGGDLSGTAKYGQSKLANLLYPQEIAKRYPQITAVSIHPGNVKTDLFSTPESSLVVNFLRRVVIPLFGVSVQEGAKNQLWAATARNVSSGQYYEPVGIGGKQGAVAKDPELARKLWEWTEKELEGQ